MNKEKFLKNLEKKLSLLSEEEKKDILTEYSDIIDEKIKHGKTEEEAVKEFGNVDELAEEILKAYKINPNYNKSDFSEKTNDFIKNGEELIKKGAKKLTDVTEEIVDGFKSNDNEVNVTNIFEIIIKVILVLVCLAFLKIPFYIISEIGSGIFGIGFSPFNHVSLFAWKAIIEVVYLALCILLVVIVINKYTKKTNHNCNKSIKKNSVQKDSIKEEVKKENINEETMISKKNSKTNSNSKSNDAFGTFLLTLIKIWCVILILMPIWFIEMGMITGICVIIYLIIKGISIYGILLLMIGITSMFGYFASILYKLLFTKKSIHIYPIFINIILIVVGGIMTFDYLANLKFIDKAPSNFNEIKDYYKIKIDEKTEISNVVEKVIDNNLEDNVLKFEVIYYDEIFDINKPILIERDNYDDYIQVTKNYKNKEYSLNNIYLNNFINNLKNNKVYNYHSLWDLKIRVYSNANTINMYE